MESIENLESLSPEEIRKTFHELCVQQIELEMQNEELRTSQADLDTARTRYFDLYDLAPVGYCTINEKGLILEANLTASTLLGYPGMRWSNNLFPALSFSMTRIFTTSIANSFLGQANRRLATADGEKRRRVPFWARLEGAVVKDSDGEFVCRVVMSDITAFKRIEAEKEKLEVQNRQLQKTESLGRMAGAIAHHFNNQLQVVMGNLEMAMDDLPQGSSTSETLTEAMKAAHKAAEVSSLMLTYLGQTPGKHEPLDLSETCRQSLAHASGRYAEKHDPEADLPSSGPIIRGEPTRFSKF